MATQQTIVVQIVNLLSELAAQALQQGAPVVQAMEEQSAQITNVAAVRINS